MTLPSEPRRSACRLTPKARFERVDSKMVIARPTEIADT